ncbi:MAG: 3-oxoacyl-ACP reductase family protein [Gemmataceae bacterium]
MLLKDQIAVVTGGSRGIGRAIVLALSREGAKVAFIYKGSQEAAQKLEAEVLASGGVAKAIQADVANTTDAERVISGVVEEWGRIDILVNNAGVIRDKLFVMMEPDDWATVLNTNLTGTFAYCKAAMQPMVFKQRRGRIVNISSIAAEHVNPGQANYAASKGAINSFTKVLAAELGKRNVLVNAVAPGFIETDMSEVIRNAAGDTIKKMIPVKRLGKPEDIANVVVFLCGPGADYITGQVITVDGGLSLGAVG